MNILVDSKLISVNNPNIVREPEKYPVNHIAKYILRFRAFHEVYKTFLDKVMYNSSQKHSFFVHINYEKLVDFIEKNTISFSIDKIEGFKEKLSLLFDEFHKEEYQHLKDQKTYFSKITILHTERQKVSDLSLKSNHNENIFLKMTSDEQKLIKSVPFRRLQYYIAELFLEHEVLAKFCRFYDCLLDNAPNKDVINILEREGVSYIDFLRHEDLRCYLYDWWIYDIQQKTPLIYLKNKYIFERHVIEYALIRSIGISLDGSGDPKLSFHLHLYKKGVSEFKLKFRV